MSGNSDDERLQKFLQSEAVAWKIMGMLSRQDAFHYADECWKILRAAGFPSIAQAYTVQPQPDVAVPARLLATIMAILVNLPERRRRGRPRKASTEAAIKALAENTMSVWGAAKRAAAETGDPFPQILSNTKGVKKRSTEGSSKSKPHKTDGVKIN